MDDQIFDNKAREEIPVDFNRPEPRWKTFLQEKKIIIGSVTALLVVAGIVWFFLSSSKVPTGPDSTNVILQLKGPSQITSGNEAEYTVVYRNGENADLVDVSLELLYPNGFKFKSAKPAAQSASGQFFNLPLVKDGDGSQVVVRGKLSGNTGDDKEIKAKLHYKLSNFNSEFVVEQSIHTSILPPDLTMDISGPVDVVNGQDTTFSVNVTNVTAQDFDNLALQLVYPSGFHFTSSNIPPTKDNNYWKLATLASGGTANIEVTGSFIGSSSEEQLVRADLGQIFSNSFAPQISSTATFKIIPSILSLTLSSDKKDYVKLGDTINYKLQYANNGRIGLSNLTITVNLDGTIIDFARINSSNAIVANNTITWKAATFSNLSSLTPSQKGEISFNVPLKKNIPSNLKEQAVKASAQIVAEETEKPTKAPDLSLKLVSEMDLDISGDYISGAAPLQVGKPTTINITLLLTNSSNDLKDVEIVASMPLPSSSWKNVIVPQSEVGRLTFDSNSGKIKWKLGSVPAFVGKYTPALQVSFQLEVVPSENDRNKVMTLLKDIQASGTDSFVNIELKTENISRVDTGSINDDVLSSKGGGTVQ